MNAAKSEFGKKVERRWKEIEAGTDRNGAELTIPEAVEDRLRQFVTSVSSARLLSLVPHAAVPTSLRTGAVTECSLTYQDGQESCSLSARLSATAEARLQIEATGWPARYRPLALLIGRFAFPRFDPLVTEVPLPVSRARQGGGFASGLPRYSLSADGGHRELSDEREACLDWHADGTVTATVELSDDAEGAFGVLEAEWTDRDGTVRRRQKAIHLRHPQGDAYWSGRTRIARPKRSADGIVRLRLRPMTADDLHLLDNRNDAGPSEVTRFLAEQEYEVRCFESAQAMQTSGGLAPGAAGDQSALLVADMGKEGTGDDPHPFESEADAVGEQLRAYRAGTTDFQEVWIQLAPRLACFIFTKCRDRHRAEDVLHETAVRILEKLAQTAHDKNLLAWCRTVAYREFLKTVRRKKASLMGDAGNLEVLVPTWPDLSPLREGIRPEHLLRLNDEEQTWYESAVAGLGDGPIADRLNRNRDEIRTIKQGAIRKLQVLQAADLLGSRLPERERRVIDMAEIQGSTVVEIEQRLDIGTADRKRLVETATAKIDAGIAMLGLLHRKKLAVHDADLIQFWLYDRKGDKELQQAFSVSERQLNRMRKSVGRRLHGQILVATDDRHLGPLRKAGRLFVEAHMVDGMSLDQTEHLVRQRVQDGRKWDGNWPKLQAHVRTVWEEKETLVPAEFAPWQLNGVCGSM